MTETAQGLPINRSTFIERVIKPYTNNPLLLRAFDQVDRALFTPDYAKGNAYHDCVIPAFEGVTSLSQPSLVAYMADKLTLTGKDRILEIGTGLGYNAAVLSCCTTERVVSVEYNATLVGKANRIFQEEGYNVQAVEGDGALGYPDAAPYDAIIVTAACRKIPKALAEQLVFGGRIVAPIGQDHHNATLTVGNRGDNEIQTKGLTQVHFMPLMSDHDGGWTEQDLDNLYRLKFKLMLQRTLKPEEVDKVLEELGPQKITAIVQANPEITFVHIPEELFV